jgi:hypothetical protein
MTNHPRRPRQLDVGDVIVSQLDAFLTVGGMVMEYVLTPEGWPGFFEWLCGEDSSFRDMGDARTRGDVARVFASLPPKRDMRPSPN